jgi:rhamnosyltransferase
MEKTLPMIFKQTFKDFEVIIVDSGTTDGALEVMKKFPVKIVQTDQKDSKTFNYARAFNEGTMASKGKYLVKLSGDALPANKHWLKRLIKGLERKDVAGICGSYLFSLKADLLFQFWFRPIFSFLREGPTSFTGGNFAIKRARWQEYHFNEKWGSGEDWEWGEAMKEKGYKILFNRDASVFHEHRSEVKKQLKDIWWYLTEGIPNQIKRKKSGKSF